MSMFTHNGGTVLSMKGKDCVAIASDKRLGTNELSTVSTEVEKVFPITPRTFLAAGGLFTELQTIHRAVRFHKNLFTLREERPMRTKTIASYLGNEMYKRRFGPWLSSPIIAGMDEMEGPLICRLDVLGGPAYVDDFAACGSAADSCIGTCEALWKPDMNPEELFEVAAQSMAAGMDRDCFSGMGIVIHVITADKVITRHVGTRMD